MFIKIYGYTGIKYHIEVIFFSSQHCKMKQQPKTADLRPELMESFKKSVARSLMCFSP